MGNRCTLAVVPSDDYLLGNTGLSTSATVAVTDNDTAQELQFQFGSIDRSASEWEEGQTYQTCVRGECTPGPAEGLFYYEDGRTFPFTQEVEERLPVHFRVIRRAEDVGKTATFVVRVEHNRGLGESPPRRLADRSRNRQPLPGVSPDPDREPETGRGAD